MTTGNDADSPKKPSIPPEWRSDPSRAPRWLRPDEAAAIIGCSRRTVDRMRARRQIRTSSPSGGSVYVCRDSLLALLERNCR
jgi:hypothetical protein